MRSGEGKKPVYGVVRFVLPSASPTDEWQLLVAGRITKQNTTRQGKIICRRVTIILGDLNVGTDTPLGHLVGHLTSVQVRAPYLMLIEVLLYRGFRCIVQWNPSSILWRKGRFVIHRLRHRFRGRVPGAENEGVFER